MKSAARDCPVGFGQTRHYCGAGVRPGVPKLYKCALKGAHQTPHIVFSATDCPCKTTGCVCSPSPDTHTGRTDVRRVVLHEKLIAMARKDWTLSRLWVMGHLGGVPNV